MYPESVRQEILDQMGQGKSLNSICKQDGMPSYSRVMAWLSEDADFQDKYARAILVRADLKFEELDEVSQKAEDSDSAVKIAGLRLKADNIKWQLARMNAKKYGDVANVNLGGTINVRPVAWEVVDPAAEGS